MKHPIKNYINKKYPEGSVTQWFGENAVLYKNAMGINGHNGIDIVAPWGTPIYAVESGLVVDVKDSPDGFGKHIRVLSNTESDGAGNEWTYGHASENLVKIGDKIQEGQIIQKTGNTGFVISGATPFWKYNPYAGTHLHLGLRRYKLSSGGWQYNRLAPRIEILNYDNGFKGAIDFSLGFYSLVLVEPGTTKQLQLTTISLANQVIDLLRKLLNLKRG